MTSEVVDLIQRYIDLLPRSWDVTVSTDGGEVHWGNFIFRPDEWGRIDLFYVEPLAPIGDWEQPNDIGEEQLLTNHPDAKSAVREAYRHRWLWATAHAWEAEDEAEAMDREEKEVVGQAGPIGDPGDWDEGDTSI